MVVLWEDDSGEGLWSGHTTNYLRVYAKSDKNLASQMLAVKLVAEYADGLVGEIVNGGYDG
jgi:hypothetical protein